MQLRRLSERTQKTYVDWVKQLTRWADKSPDRVTEEEMRDFFLYLTNEKQLSSSSVNQALCSLKFFTEQVLGREWMHYNIPFVRQLISKEETKMRIILSDFISLDGVVQAPGGRDEDTNGGFQHGGWSMPFFDPESMGAAIDEVMQSTEALLFGRQTWEAMAGAWPERASDPFADRMNAIPKYVVSRTLSAAEASSRWNNTTLLGRDGDAIESIRSLKADGGDAVMQVMGSASLARQLVENELIDEYRLMLEPILLGGGKSIFPSDGRARSLELVSVAQAKTGVLICVYRPAATTREE